MKTSLKTLRIVLLSILILVVVTVAAISLFADRALRMGVETAATRALNVGVSIADADLSIMSGKIGFENLVIDNPPGYQHDKLLELSDVRIKVDISSLLSDVVNIREIRLDGVNVVLEQRGVSSNNLQDIIKTMSGEPKARAESRSTGKKLHIDELEITNIKVKVKLLPVPGKADTVTLELTPIRMSNLGTDNKLSTGVLFSKIVVAIAEGIAEQGVGVLPKEIVNTMKSTLDTTMELSKTVSKEGEKVIEAGKDAAGELVEGFKGLLKPKKEE